MIKCSPHKHLDNSRVNDEIIRVSNTQFKENWQTYEYLCFKKMVNGIMHLEETQDVLMNILKEWKVKLV